ncbi:MAG: hypothetical protein P8X42_14765, partial [Calditrichaceae bacterium]
MKNDSKSGDQLVEEVRRLKKQLYKRKKELAEIRQSLDSAVNSINDIIFYKNVNGVYVECNQALIDFTSLSKRKILGKT